MPEKPPVIPVEARDRGPYLPDLDLWLDPHRKRDRAFVSHAHSDHYAPHRLLYCSDGTRTLIERRFGPRRTEYCSAGFGEDLILDGHRLRLLPAGHIAGSAQLFVERLSDGATLLYTGDFKLRRGFAAEEPEWLRADTLVMETTFGLPKYRLPPSEEVVGEMVRFARATLAEGGVPVFLAYSLGKAQEALMALHDGAPELAFRLHPAVARMTAAVSELGFRFPPFEEFDPRDEASLPGGRVHILPPTGRRPERTAAWRGARFAMVTGWAIDRSARYRFGVDEAFALSDHADYDDLLRCVESRVRPRRVLTLHGYAREFAADLRARGWEAWSLEGADQLELDLFPPPAAGM